MDDGRAGRTQADRRAVPSQSSCCRGARRSGVAASIPVTRDQWGSVTPTSCSTDESGGARKSHCHVVLQPGNRRAHCRPRQRLCLRPGMGLETPGDLAEDGVPEPLRVQLNEQTCVMYVPTGGFGWITGGRATAEPGTSECLLSLQLGTTTEVDSLLGRVEAAGGRAASGPEQKAWGYRRNVHRPRTVTFGKPSSRRSDLVVGSGAGRASFATRPRGVSSSPTGSHGVRYRVPAPARTMLAASTPRRAQRDESLSAEPKVGRSKMQRRGGRLGRSGR